MDKDANSASKEDLMSLKGVGEELADTIIQTRPFESIDGLLSVPGIGPKSLEFLKAQGLRVAPAPEPAPEAVQASKRLGRKEEAIQERDEISEGSLGDEETIAERLVYYEAPAGALTIPQEVEGFNKEGIKEYRREYRSDAKKMDRPGKS